MEVPDVQLVSLCQRSWSSSKVFSAALSLLETAEKLFNIAVPEHCLWKIYRIECLDKIDQ